MISSHFKSVVAAVVISIGYLSSQGVQAQLTNVNKQKPPGPPHQYTKDSFKVQKQVPSNFPAPVYASNVVSTSYQETASIKGLRSMAAIIKTSDPPQTAYQWYQSSLPSFGYEIYPPKVTQAIPAPPAGVEYYTIKAHKDGQFLYVSCSRLPKHPDTAINVTITAQ